MNLVRIELISIIIFIICLFIIFLLFGKKIFINNILIISSYVIIVPIIFFSFGSYIEKIAIKKQIIRLINKIKYINSKFNIDLNNEIKLEVNKEDNVNVKKINKTIIRKAFFISSIIFIIGLIISLYMAKINNMKFIPILKYNSIILLIIIIVELLFFSLISKNYLSIDSNDILRYIIIQLANKMKE